jgi:hypothetical protein
MRNRSQLATVYLVIVLVTTTLPSNARSGVSAQPNDDVLVLTNGNQLTGRLTRIDESSVEIFHSSMGQVKVPWSGVDHAEATESEWTIVLSGNTAGAHSRLTRGTFRFVTGLLDVRIDNEAVRLPAGAAILLQKAETRQLSKQEHDAGPPTPPTAKASSQPALSKFEIGVNAPQTVVDGTQSQETFGGNVAAFYRPQPLCGPASWYTAMFLSAAHNRNWKVHSAANVTDTYDADLSLKNEISKGSRTSWVLVADLFGNSSLGVGLQQSYGGGLSRVLYTNTCNGTSQHGIVSIAGSATIRYLHERLYAPGTSAEFAGLNFQSSMSFTPLFKDKKGNQVERISGDITLWTMPTLNDIRGIQTGGQVTISSPLTSSLSIALKEEDDFINNAPKAKRKNYLKSGVTLTYTFPAPPH